MDTRSKRFSNNIILRTAIFLLCAVMVTIAMLSLVLAVCEHQLAWRVDYAVYLQDADVVLDTSRIMSNIWYAWAPIMVPTGLVAMISLLWLMITTGARKHKVSGGWAQGITTSLPDNPRKTYLADRIWTELQIAALIASVTLGSLLLVEWYDYFVWQPIRPAFQDFVENGFTQHYTSPERYELFNDLQIIERLMYPEVSVFKLMSDAAPTLEFEAPLAAAGFACCMIVALWFLLSLIRLIKTGRFFKNALIVQLCAAVGGAVGRTVMNVVNGGSLMRKVVLLLGGIALLSATIIGAPIMIILVVIFAPKWVKRFEEIQNGVDEVKSGNLAYKIPINENGKEDELTRLARGINEISEASNLAVKNELKNQRMKTELISNVSHDLKTPLTSLVTYIDLLKSEGLDSPNAPEYLEILDSKTERLRKLTEDLFEAAKASSGAMPVNMESVDALSLVNQVMGEMNDCIESSELEFILKHSREALSQGANVKVVQAGTDGNTDNVTSDTAQAPAKYMVDADGQLLYRVVDNLLNNVLKYAQPGSRVYIDISEPLDFVLIEFKNISKQALNIDPDELMERFKRGDESRTTEGSGLGLAIAKDLVKLMGGWLEIVIDGDLFKARVFLNKSPEYKQPDPANAV